MNFNRNVDGFQNEFKINQYLNQRKVKELSPNFKSLLECLYPNISEESVIFSKVDFNNKKTDLIIIVNDEIRRVSIKKGIKNSVHVEGISSFIHFLIENKIPIKIIDFYLKYHYADGTTNGSGQNRVSVDKYKESHQHEIDEINKVFNNPNLVEKAIDRFVLQGRNSIHKIDVLIYGILEDFIWITSDDIKKILMSKIGIYSTAVHFSSLTCQPLNRCLNYNHKYEKYRYCIQIKWYNICDEIIENMNNKFIDN